ncbi:hypothetical protein L7F22_002636 [Adiantum nelumboides]|nr:hypothetical protein [Adiantum nelumboides]
MLGKRFQRTTSMAQIGPNACPSTTEEQYPPSEPISQWEILKQAEEMMKMMMAAAGSGSASQSDAAPVRAPVRNPGHHAQAAFQQASETLIPRVSFLENCFLCKRRLKHERDIFIYRGDAAFCTEECRQRQILKDESHARGASSEKGSASAETAVAA